MNTRPYHFVELEQGTSAWLTWRQKGIGASDAPIIMRENPWKEPSELLEEKRCLSPQTFENKAMQIGTALEPMARESYMTRMKTVVSPACLQSGTHSWLRASVDGIASDGSSVVEIKCGESVYKKTSQSKKVPAYYYGQLQHILAVTGLQTIDFWCFQLLCPEVLVKVQRNESYIERLLVAEEAFFNSI